MRNIYLSVVLITLLCLFFCISVLGSIPPHPRVEQMIKEGKIALPYHLANRHEALSRGINAPVLLPQGVKYFGQQKYLTTTTFKAIAILIKFSDNPSQVASVFFDSLLYAVAQNSLRNYFTEVSYQTLDVVTVNFPSTLGWMNAPQTYSYYVAGNYGFGSYPQNAQKLTEDAIAAANSVVDFSQYDNNSDGYVDALFIIHAGPGAEFTGNVNDIWSHQWVTSTPQLVDGVYASVYSMEPEYWQTPGDMACGVYAHEAGHAIFGLPDLYDYGYDSRGLGRWSLMASGSWSGPLNLGESPAHPDAWSRYAMGFVAPVNITADMTDVQIPAVKDSAKIFRLWTNGSSSTEYFLVENRQKIGYDTYLREDGLCIYHIDETQGDNDNQWYPGYTNYGHYKVAIEQADGLWDLEKYINSGDTGDPYPGSTSNTVFNNISTPNSKDYNFNNTSVAVTNIGASGMTMTADFSVEVVPPEIDVSPDSLFADLYAGDDTTQTLTINNSGLGELSFNIMIEDITTVLKRSSSKFNNAFAGFAPVPLININKGEVDTRIYPAMTMSGGGPDPYGYRWKDSDEPGGPVFSWIDVNLGTSIYLSDDSYITGIPLGFTFNYYGIDYTMVNIMSNGWLSFNDNETWFPSNVPAVDGYSGAIAPFGYDLYPPSANYIRYKTFGDAPNRYFVVEYNSIPNYGGGNNKTFEIILYEGCRKIRFQYLTAPDDPIGFGIESPDETMGMGNAGSGDLFINPSVVKNDYAIEFSSGPDWLTATPSTGVVPPSSSVNIDVTFNTIGKDGGEYDANIFVINNDPDEDTVRVPAHMHVTGAPNIALSDTSIDFDTVFVSVTHRETLTVSNVGTDVLNVSNISSDNSDYSVSTTNFSLNPDEHLDVVVTFTPSVVGERVGTLTITSDDPDEGTLTVDLVGVGIEPPNIVVSPTSLDTSLYTGEQATKILTIENTGASDLMYEITIVEPLMSSTMNAAKVIQANFRSEVPIRIGKLGKHGTSLEYSSSSQSSKGNGIVRSTQDVQIAPITVAIVQGDWYTTNLWTYLDGLPDVSAFEITSYDLATLNNYDVVIHYGNSFIDQNALNSYVNQGGGLIGTPWMLLNLGGAVALPVQGPVYNPYFSTPLNVIVYNPTDPILQNVTFVNGDLVGYESGITLKTGATAPAYWNDGTPLVAYWEYGSGKAIYIDLHYITSDCQIAIQYGWGQELIKNAVKYAAGKLSSWLSVNPTSGVVSPSSSMNIDVTFNASGMNGGDYDANILIVNNDPDPNQDTVIVPAHMHVTGAPNIALSDTSIDFDTVFVSVTHRETLTVSNVGTDVLNVSNISSDNSDYSVSATNFSLNPDEHLDVVVTFTPSVVGERVGTLTITSDDPDEGTLEVDLVGVGVEPPNIVVSPTSMSSNLFTGEMETQTLTISNTAEAGSADLHFNIALQLEGTMSVDKLFVSKKDVTSSLETRIGEIPSGTEYHPNQVIVKFKRGVQAAQAMTTRSEVGATIEKRFKLIGAELWNVSGVSVADVISRYRGNPLIEYVEPNYIVRAIDRIPNDPYFSSLWGMQKIQAPTAWDRTTGSDVLMGVIDTGVDPDHVDLIANIWTNSGEIAGNGIDDDGNGYIDDIHGWDFYNNDNNPYDDNGHGTHVSGTIAAIGNNGVGVVGVCWSAKIMALKFLDAGGSGYTDDAISALEYAIMMNVRLTSNSWGGGGYSQALFDAIQAAGAAGDLFIAAAGNSSLNNDSYPHYPSSYTLDNIISVASTTSDDQMSGFSNYGLVSVDLGAPGSDIMSTFPGNTYGTISGTSMATPHVSGVAGLILSLNSTLGWADVKGIITSTVDPIAALSGKCVTGGRLNANNAVQAVQTWLSVNPLSGTVAAENSVELDVTFDATGLNGGDYNGNILIISNDPTPEEDTISVSALLHVTGAPDIALSDTSFNYDTVFIGVAKRETLTVSNVGTDVLNVSDISSDNTDYTVDVTNFSLNPDEHLDVVVTFTPSVVGERVGTLTIISNDPDEGTVEVDLVGVGVEPPNIVVSPTSLDTSLYTGEQATKILTIENTGASNLTFDVSVEGVSGLTSISFIPNESLKAMKVRAIGKPIPLDDLKDMPTVMSVSSNDLIDKGKSFQHNPSITNPSENIMGVEIFGSMENIYFAGPRTRGNLFSCITSTTLLEHRFYLNPSASTQLWFLAYEGNTQVGTYNLISASNVTPAGPGEGWYSSGIIDVSLEAGKYYLIVASFEQLSNYYNQQNITPYPISTSFGQLTAGVGWNWAPIAIFPPANSQDVPSDAFGDPVAYYQALVTGVGTSWLSVNPTSGVVSPGSSVNIDVTFNASGMNGGDYDAEILIKNNDPDPDQDTVIVPAHLHVTGAPDIALSDTSFDYDTVFIGVAKRETLRVSNCGTDVLNVSDITSDNSDYSVSPTNFNVNPIEYQDVVVTFTPSVVGERIGTLTITSDDPDEGTLDIDLVGVGVEPPNVVVTPTSLDTSLNTGQQATKLLTINNTGGSNLNFTIDINNHAMITTIGKENNILQSHSETIQDQGPKIVMFEPGKYITQSHGGTSNIKGRIRNAMNELKPFTVTKTSSVGLNVLLAYADDGASYIASQLLSYPDIAIVDGYDTRYSTPALSQLQNYDVVVAWTNYDPFDATALGNVLADYVDQGGGVILGTFAWSFFGTLTGRIMDPSYTPLVMNGGNYYDLVSMVIVDPNHPIMSGVSFASDIYHSYTALTPDAHLVAQWNNGDNMIAVKGRIVGLNSYIGDYFSWSGDISHIVHNSIVVVGAGVPWLSANPTSGVVPMGSSMNIEVTFDATDLDGADYYANILIVNNDPDEDQDTVIVPVSLTVGVPVFAVTPLNLSFGSVNVGVSKTDSVTVTNPGSDPLVITSINSDVGQFTVAPTSAIIAPSTSRRFYITFSPSSGGTKSGNIIFTHNALGSPDTVSVSGTGVLLPSFAVSPTAIDFGTIEVGSYETDSVQVSNTGLGTLSIASVTSNNSQLVVLPENAVLAPSTTRWFIITYTPTTFGEISGIIIFTHNAMNSPDTVTVIGRAVQNIQLSIMNHWNMVSIPMNAMSPLKNTLFPTAISEAFKYDENYKETDSLFPGHGYWLKFDAAQSVPFTGFYFINDTVDVQPDWNMIGALSTPVHISRVIPQGTDIRSLFFGYKTSYYATDSLIPGQGYFVKVSDSGKLIISSGDESPLPAKVTYSVEVFDEMNKLIFEDASGNIQSIYYRKSNEGTEFKTFYDAPPKPPKGCFDVRYESQRIAEVFTSIEKYLDFSIVITDAIYPIKIRWNITKDLEHQSIIFDIPNGKRLNHNLRSETGEITISDKKVNEIVLRIAQVPKEFLLYQNYPNPFNPMTTIRYQLPVDCKVSLKIYNILGREVKILVDEIQEAGYKLVEWNASDYSSGVYFYRLTTKSEGKSFVSVKKLLLMK